MVALNQYNELNRNPGTYIEFDPSQASSALVTQSRAVLIGQLTADATVAENSFNFVSDNDQAKLLFGQGSHLADLYAYFKENNPNIRVDAIPLGNNGTAAVKTITVTGPATEAGILNVYIANLRVIVQVASGDSADTIATAIANAVDANTDMLMGASAATNVVTLTAKNTGEWTDQIPVLVNPFTASRQGSDKNPAGTSFVIANTVAGASNEDISTAIAALPDEVITDFCMPYTDSANMTAWTTELDRRNQSMVQLEGFGLAAKTGTTGALTAFGTGQNNEFNLTLDAGKSDFMADHQVAAAAAGLGSLSAGNDPAAPWARFADGELKGVTPDFVENRRSFNDRNTLLYSGIATTEVTHDGKVIISREITNFQKNSGGQPSTAYLDSQTPRTLQAIRQSFLARMSKFKGYKLADDGAFLTGGSLIATPSSIRADIVAWATILVQEGLIENLDQFEADLIVERDATDPTRVNVVLPPDLVNQLRIIAGKITFTL